MGVWDEKSDWYDVANDTWLSKEQRDYAQRMLEIEKRRKEEIDSKVNVHIDLEKGTTDLKLEEEDELFSFGNQS